MNTSSSSSSSSYFSDTEQEKIRTIVTSYLKDAMDHDVFVVPTSITKLVYVGNSSTTPPIVSGSNNSSSELSGHSMKTGWLIVLIGFLVCLAILVCCCCCFLLCCGRRKRRKQRRQTTDPHHNSDTNNRSTVRSIVDITHNDNNVGTGKDQATVEGKQGLASFDSLALKGGNDIETILFDNSAHDREIPTDSDSSGFDDDISNHNIPTTLMINGISNDNNLVKEDEAFVADQEILDTDDTKDDTKDDTNHNDDTSEELVGQKVVEMIVESEKTIDAHDADDTIDGESLVETLSDEMDLLDRLATQGRPPPYPTTSQHKSTDLLMIAPTRSLSPTTISAASLGTSTTYTGARNIVGSPTTCSQVTMPAGNLRYNNNHRTTTTTTTRTGGLMKKFMMVPQHQKQRFIPTNTNSGSIRTAYTPDSFDEEILGITSADSRDNNNMNGSNRTRASPASVPVAKHMTVHEEQQQYQHRHHSPPHTAITTYPDVLDEHLSNTFNENDDEMDDDLFSFQSDHNHDTSTVTGTSNAVQRHLQMS